MENSINAGATIRVVGCWESANVISLKYLSELSRFLSFFCIIRWLITVYCIQQVGIKMECLNEHNGFKLNDFVFISLQLFERSFNRFFYRKCIRWKLLQKWITYNFFQLRLLIIKAILITCYDKWYTEIESNKYSEASPDHYSWFWTQWRKIFKCWIFL